MSTYTGRVGARLLLWVTCWFLLQMPLGARAEEKPVAGGTLNLLVQPEPPTLMLGLNQQGPTQFAASKIYQSLLTYGTVVDDFERWADLHVQSAQRREVARWRNFQRRRCGFLCRQVPA
jgi:hypothetical protein